MSCLRAFLAVFLALTWCSAVMHAELEAVDWMLDHEHHAQHAGHGEHHAPGGVNDDHEVVFARDAAKDAQIRIGASGVLWFAIIGVPALSGSARQRRDSDDEAIPIRRQADPPLAQIWQFEWRCASEAAAPPVLG